MEERPFFTSGARMNGRFRALVIAALLWSAAFLVLELSLTFHVPLTTGIYHTGALYPIGYCCFLALIATLGIFQAKKVELYKEHLIVRPLIGKPVKIACSQLDLESPDFNRRTGRPSTFGVRVKNDLKSDWIRIGNPRIKVLDNNYLSDWLERKSLGVSSV